MELENTTPLAVAFIPQTGPEGSPVLTIIVKGTFTIVPGAPAMGRIVKG